MILALVCKHVFFSIVSAIFKKVLVMLTVVTVCPTHSTNIIIPEVNIFITYMILSVIL